MMELISLGDLPVLCIPSSYLIHTIPFDRLIVDKHRDAYTHIPTHAHHADDALAAHVEPAGRGCTAAACPAYAAFPDGPASTCAPGHAAAAVGTG